MGGGATERERETEKQREVEGGRVERKRERDGELANKHLVLPRGAILKDFIGTNVCKNKTSCAKKDLEGWW